MSDSDKAIDRGLCDECGCVQVDFWDSEDFEYGVLRGTWRLDNEHEGVHGLVVCTEYYDGRVKAYMSGEYASIYEFNCVLADPRLVRELLKWFQLAVKRFIVKGNKNWGRV